MQLGTGVTGIADVNTKWYKGASLKSTTSLSENTNDISKYCSHSYNASKPIVSANNGNIEDVVDAGALHIYPNPIAENGTLYLDLNPQENETSSIQISNLQGQIVYKEVTSEKYFSINTSGILKQGLYFITVNTSGNTQLYKLVVE